MEYRHLGRSGVMVSEIAYGNWITHGSQVEEDAARACVAAALDEGITTFDTADVYAGTRAEEVLGRALQGDPARVDGDLHEGVLAHRRRPRMTAAFPASTSWSRSTARCGGCRPTTSTCTRRTGTTTRRRWRRPSGLRRPGPARQGAVHRGVGVDGLGDRGRANDRRRAGLDRIVSNQPQYKMLWRVIEAEVVPMCERGIGQIVWSPIAQGVLTGKYLPGAALPTGSRATDATPADFIRNWPPTRC